MALSSQEVIKIGQLFFLIRWALTPCHWITPQLQQPLLLKLTILTSKLPAVTLTATVLIQVTATNLCSNPINVLHMASLLLILRVQLNSLTL